MNLRVTLILPALLLALATLKTNTPLNVHSATHNAVGIDEAKGCNITVKAENKSERTLVINLAKSQVRSKQIVAGFWSDLVDKNDPVTEMYLGAKAPTLSTTFGLKLWCDLKRQYKFLIEERVGTGVVSSVWVYYPSQDDWADANTKTINLGNIGRHFN
jgi:hypothetical protein